MPSHRQQRCVTHLNFANPPLATLAKGKIEELYVGLKGTMNALFLKDLAQKTLRGLEGRVREGRSGDGFCYGCDIVRASDAVDNALEGNKTINNDEAEIVRTLFRGFTRSPSPTLTANAQGKPGPRSGAWDS